MKYIIDKLPTKHLRAKICFWDDCVLAGSPAAIAEAAELISELSEETGLELKWSKCHLNAPSKEIGDECRNLFTKGIQIHDSMNLTWMKVPIGSDEYVIPKLEAKLDDLQHIVSSIVDMPFKHEAFTLLRYCAAECRVTHLCRTVPPVQIKSFLEKFDRLIRKGFEKMIGIELEDRWWRICKLPSKFVKN